MIWNPNKECMSRDEMSALQGPVFLNETPKSILSNIHQ